MAVGYAKDADDISDVRKFVEYISYPGNPSLTREADENSDKSERYFWPEVWGRDKFL